MITQLARVYSGSMSGNGTCKGRKSLREGASADTDTQRSVHPQKKTHVQGSLNL
jgi:hypothetical protein